MSEVLNYFSQKKYDELQAKKNIYVYFRFQLWKKQVWSVGIISYFLKIFYIEIAFFNTFFSKDNILLRIRNKMFRSGQKPR